MNSAAPQLSPDGKWWWTGTEWVPAQQAPQPAPAPAPASPTPVQGVRQAAAGAIVCDDQWYWAMWGRWKPLFDQKGGQKPGRDQSKAAKAIAGDNASAIMHIQQAGAALGMAVQQHGSLPAAERAIEETLPPGFKPPAGIGSALNTPSAEIVDGMLTVKGQSPKGKLTQPSVQALLDAVTGVTVQRTSFLYGTLVLQGHGTELGRVEGAQLQAEKTAEWIRERLIPQQPVQVNVQHQTQDITGELERLTRLLERGVLKQSEFDDLKARLLAR